MSRPLLRRPLATVEDDITRIGRRQILVALVIAAVGRCAVARAVVDDTAATPGAVVPTVADWQDVIETMFPHRRVDRALYGLPAEALVAAAAKDSDTRQLLIDGWSVLNRRSGGSWATAEATARHQAISGIVDSPLFAVLRQTVVFTFYANAQVWAACGYEGDAWVHGGWIGPDLVTVNWLSDPPASDRSH